MNKLKLSLICFALISMFSVGFAQVKISGIYPHLAAFGPTSGKKNETGIGAVVPWAGKLWYLTYSAHEPKGSHDKLYSIDNSFTLSVRPESIGGTPANRLIHKESNQLFIGPYAINAQGNVRAIPYSAMAGRHTATARHLTDPDNKVYYFDMEGKVYEVDVQSLAVTKLFEDPVPGGHGKGAYTGQGQFVVANNGYKSGDGPEDYGALAQWNGTQWDTLMLRQFCDVTGPGGIQGAPNDNAPIWAIGWDKRSVLLMLLDNKQWHTFRLPKGTHSYEHTGGWYTEWPRIREVTGGMYLMDMFGLFYDFPSTFTSENTAGIKPISTHLRYVPDFCDWNGTLVLATDETSVMKDDPKLPGPLAGRSQSNLWFGKVEELHSFGPRSGWGGPWLNDEIKADQPSHPFLINGFNQKILHLAHDASASVSFTIEADYQGNGTWQTYKSISVGSKGYGYEIFPSSFNAQWIRITSNVSCKATAYFHYFARGQKPDAGKQLFSGLAEITDSTTEVTAGILIPDRTSKRLQYLMKTKDKSGNRAETYYEIDQKMQFSKPPSRAQEVKDKAGRAKDFTIDDASVIITYDGKRYRVPKGHHRYSQKDATDWWPRGAREIESERSCINIHGTFYELPREGGMEKVKPLVTHNKQIVDYCTWSGLLVLSGVRTNAQNDGNTFMANDNATGLWFGSVDDLWKLGQPVGIGGPWKNSSVTANVVSDPYLMTGYDKKTMQLSHNSSSSVRFSVEVNFDHESWYTYKTFSVPSGETTTHLFPKGYSAHWVRLKTDRSVTATAQFFYDTTSDTTTHTVWTTHNATRISHLGLYPNPFKGSTSLSFSLAKKGVVSITLFNTKGKIVRTISNKVHSPGQYTYRWDGRDDASLLLGTGIYYFRIHTGEYQKTIKTVLLR